VHLIRAFGFFLLSLIAPLHAILEPAHAQRHLYFYNCYRHLILGGNHVHPVAYIHQDIVAIANGACQATSRVFVLP
jgi:hypothetical protein